MKFLTTLRHNLNYTADATNYTGGSGFDGLTKVYDASPYGQIKFAGGSAPGDNLVIYTLEPVRLFVRLDNLRDKDGNLLLPWEAQIQGATYEVRTCQPTLTLHGTVEGYRLNLTRV